MRHVFLMALMTLSFGAMADQAVDAAPTAGRAPASVQPKAEKTTKTDALGQSAQSEDQMLGALQTSLEKADSTDDAGSPE